MNTTMNKKLTCKLCGYKWESRKEDPKECPQCKRRGWDGKVISSAQEKKK